MSGARTWSKSSPPSAMRGDIGKSCLASFRIEVAHLRRSLLFLALALVQGMTFLVLVSLFALTGSRRRLHSSILTTPLCHESL